MRPLVVVLANLLAGFAGSLLGGALGGFLRTAAHIVVPDWVPLLIILGFAVAAGILLGRWRRGPTLRDMAIGSVAYLVINYAITYGSAPLALTLTGSGVIVLASFAAWFWASRSRMAAIPPDGTASVAAVAPEPMARWQRWVFGIAGVVMTLSGLSTLYTNFFATRVIMAGCAEGRVTDVVKTLIETNTHVSLTTVADITTVSTNSDKAVCTALLTLSNGETGRMGYDITVADGHYQVLLTGLVKPP